MSTYYPSDTFLLSDFPNQKVDINRLEQEIVHSETYGFDRFHAVFHRVEQRVNANIVETIVWFKDPLVVSGSYDDRPTIAAIVAAHQGLPLRPYQQVRIENSLHDTDNRQIVTNWPVGFGWRSWICGASDDEDPPIIESGRGTGDKFLIDFVGPATSSIQISFSEPVQIRDGTVFWEPRENWSAKDDFDIGVSIPATTGSLATGSEGNTVGVSQLGGAYTLYVPPSFAGGTGSHVVNMSTTSPAPAADNDGYWNWDVDTGVVTPVTGTVPNGNCHLINVPQLIYMIRRVPMPSSVGFLEIRSEKVEQFHPNWNMFLNVRKVTSGSGIVSSKLHAFRRNAQ